MGDVFARCLSTVESLQPREWTSNGLQEFLDARAIVRCSCGAIDVIADEHEVLADGRVVPVWTCPAEGCGKREFITLESWGA